jgi:hypothetical protein
MKSLLLFAFLVLAIPASGQFRALPSTSRSSVLTSYLLADQVVASKAKTNPLGNFSSSSEEQIPGHKSTFLAAVFSLVIPGLGEYYVGDKNWWHGLIFTGLEAGLWLEYSHWMNRGDDSTTAFHNFSDTHFNLSRYAGYMNGFVTRDSIKTDTASASNPSSINRLEGILDSLSSFGADPTIKNFTHRLPFDDRQQYYELISKYLQYIPGWDNVVNWNTASEMRERMNDQYGIATYFLWGAIANHVLSAIDAAILAGDHNSRLRLHGDMIRRPYSNGSLGYVPRANIQYTF